jgi:hypothetical protein
MNFENTVEGIPIYHMDKILTFLKFSPFFIPLPETKKELNSYMYI